MAEPHPPAKPSRRRLRFNSLQEALDEARRCVRAQEIGRLATAGNWSCGQVLGHLAWWIDEAYAQEPVRLPLLLRLMGRLMKKRVLRGPSPVNFRLPGVPGGTYGTQEMPAAEGLKRLEAAVARLEAAAPARPDSGFGPLTHEEWKLLHIRHAEGHLGCLVPLDG